MVHPRLGDDPQWALSHARERLELTDPPTASTPRPHARHARRWAAALAAMLALAATVCADTEPTAPGREPITTTAAAHPVQATRAVPHAAPDRRRPARPGASTPG